LVGINDISKAVGAKLLFRVGLARKVFPAKQSYLDAIDRDWEERGKSLRLKLGIIKHRSRSRTFNAAEAALKDAHI